MKSRLLEGTPTITVGISAMRERVQDLGGTFSIESAKNKGCLVRATISSDDKPRLEDIFSSTVLLISLITFTRRVPSTVFI